MEVLLVEDDDRDVLQLKQALTEIVAHDIRISEVGRLADARQALINADYDVVVLDLTLPDSLGFDALWQLHEQAPETPIIVFSSVDDEHVARTALSAGAHDYIIKGQADGIQISRILRYAIQNDGAGENQASPSQHDELTGLPNLGLFEDRLETALAHARRHHKRIAVHIVDIDGLKAINDAWGPAAGNELMRATAARLRETVRETDTVARLSDDEFGILQTEIDEAQSAAVLADKLIDAATQPLAIGSHTTKASVAIGIAVHPQNGKTAAELIRNAELAFRQSKQAIAHRFQFFDQDMDVAVAARAQHKREFASSLAQQEFVVHYQPQIEIDTRRIHGVEALVRWRHPQRGFMRPDAFVPAAEHDGSIEPLGKWVLDRTLQQLSEWRRAGLPDITVAFNVSAFELLRSDIYETIVRALERSATDASLLELEFDDTVLTRHEFVKLEPALRRLADIGVRMAVDDFGSGAGALMFLRDLPITTVKIDQSLTREIGEDREIESLVRAISSLGQGSPYHVLAEGVETDRQLRFLGDAGCNSVQGYYFGPAVPGEIMSLRLAEQAKHAPTPLHH